MTSIKKMEVFSTVAELKSFTGAAEALYMTQPAISWQIKALEEEIGLRLFNRHDKNLELTEAGSRFYQTCQQILSLYRQSEEYMSEYRGLSCGSLKLGASTIPGEYILPQALSGFIIKYPGLNVSLSIGGTVNIIKELSIGHIDLAIVGAKTVAPQVEYTEWLPDEMILVTARNSSLPQKMAPEDLVKYPLIWRETTSGSRIILESALAEKNIFVQQWPATIRLGSTQAVINSVLSSNAMAFISIWAVEHLISSGDLRRITVPQLKLTRHFYLASWNPDYMSNAARACKEYLEDYRASNPQAT